MFWEIPQMSIRNTKNVQESLKWWASRHISPHDNLESASNHACLCLPQNTFRFFLQEIQMGEMLIANGHIEQGVEHLANAVVVCGQPTQLLQVLQQTLPAQVFTLLIHKMKEYRNKMEPQGTEGRVEELSDDLE